MISRGTLSLVSHIFIWIFFIASFLWMAKAVFLGYYPDFVTQYYVPKLTFSGANPYQGGEGLYTPQVYPPSVALLYFPLTFLPLNQASIVFTIFSIVCLLVSIFLLSRIFSYPFFSIPNLCIATLIFISFPAKFTLGMGQMNMIILLLLTLVLYFQKKQKEFLAGIFLGASIAIKLFPVILPIYMLVKISKDTKRVYVSRWVWSSFFKSSTAHVKMWLKPKQLHVGMRFLSGIFLGVGTAAVLVLVFVPLEQSRQFLFEILPDLFFSWKTDYYNQSLSGFIGRSFGIGQLGSVLKLILSFIITTVVIIIIVRNEKENLASKALKFGAIINASLIINTFSWQHHFVWMIIPFYATFYYLRKFDFSKNYYLALVVSYFLVSINFKDPSVLPLLLQSHVFLGAFVLLLLDLLLLLRNKQF